MPVHLRKQILEKKDLVEFILKNSLERSEAELSKLSITDLVILKVGIELNTKSSIEVKK